MEFFFIVILAIGLFVLWLRSQDTTSSLRDDIARLEREIGFLQSQLSSLVKAQAASASPHPAQESPAKEIKAARSPFLSRLRQGRNHSSRAAHSHSGSARSAAGDCSFQAPAPPPIPVPPAAIPKPAPPVRRQFFQGQL